MVLGIDPNTNFVYSLNREIILPVFQISQVREISAHYSVETACVSDISVRIAC